MLSFSEACERNKVPILKRLRALLPPGLAVLEVGSGTAQHAVYFASQLPAITWLPSDVSSNLPAIEARLAAEGPVNVRPPVALDVRDEPWPVSTAGAVFSANVLHIVSEDCVRHFFRGAGQVLAAGGLLIAYGPFRYAGHYTSESNAEFDQWLKLRDPASGIRDFETVDALAEAEALQLVADHPMPANNQLLVWRKVGQAISQ